MDNLLNKIMLDDIDIPGVPDIAVKVMGLLEDERCSLKRLEEVIFTDQLLTTSILKIANAPFYQTGKSVNTLAEAIMAIGMHNLLALVSIVSLTNQLSGKLHDATLIRHAMAVSTISAKLSTYVKGMKKEEALVAGLLHDIGRTIIAANAPAHYKRTQEVTVKEGKFTMEAEDEVLGFTHCHVGSAMAKKWKFPKIYDYVIKRHHDYRVKKPLQTQPLSYEDKLCYIVRLADKAALDAGIGSERCEEAREKELRLVLGIEDTVFTEIAAQLKAGAVK